MISRNQTSRHAGPSGTNDGRMLLCSKSASADVSSRVNGFFIHTSAYDSRIQKDKMNLTVTNRSPVFQKKTEQEIRQEISEGLYRIYRKYG